MATASANHMVLWTDLEGTELNGRWRLVKQVRSEGRTGWFEGRDADGKPVMLILTETLNDEDELMERLRLAGEIHHPNVVAIHDSLLTNLDDTPMVMAATELTEENLSDVLRERALGVEETRQVLDAVLGGLTAIHARGLVHGRMEAASVLATGDTIKLRSDCVHAAGDQFAGAAGEDVRGLGRIVVQALTRRIPTGENDPVLQLVPEPMARAVRKALSGRATVEEMATLAGIRIVPGPAVEAAKPAAKPAEAVREVKPAPRNEPVAAPQPVEASVVKPVEAAKAPAPAAEKPPVAARPTPAVEKPVVTAGAMAEPVKLGSPSDLLLEDDDAEEERHRGARWIVIAAAALVLITIFVLYGMMHRSPKKEAVAPAVVTAPAAPAASAPVPAHAAPARPAATTPAPAAAAAGWRVVAYTYLRQGQAQEKADALHRRYPNLQFGVFAPKGRPEWLVTVGGVMDRDTAIQMRARALRMGFPHDTYARNYR